MRLAAKLTAALLLGILVVMAGYAYVQVRQEVVLFESDLPQNAPRGRAFRAAIQVIWRNEGEERAREIVAEVASGMSDAEARWTRTAELRADAAHLQLSAENLTAIAAGDILELVHRDDAGEMRRYHYLPMGIDDIVLEASGVLRRETTFVHMSHRAILLATALITLVCGLIALGLGVRFVGRPIRLLRDQARRIGAGDLSTRLALRQHDEIGELAREMNALCDRLAEANRRIATEAEARIAALEQLRHKDRLATVGQLASGVAHELGTPLSIVAARASLLGSADVSMADVAQNARIIVEQAHRMTEIIRQLLDFSRRRGAQLGTTDVQRLVERTLDLLASVARGHRVTFHFAGTDAPVLVRLDQNQVQQALTNVIVNGIQSMPSGGRLTVALRPARARPPVDHGGPEDEYLCITVEDEGTGIAPENFPRIFEPFFTTKGVGEGTGLGLSVAYGIVAEHGGWIEVESEVGTGTRFRVFLPLAAISQAELREVAS